VRLLNPRPTHKPAEFFILDFSLVSFLAFSGKGSSKTPLKRFCKKFMSKTFENNRHKFRCQFPLDFFCFIAFSGSQRWELKNTKEYVLQKIVSKSVLVSDKKNERNPKPTGSRCLLSRFWAFLGEGSSKTPLKKYIGKRIDPGPFLATDPPTHHGGHCFVLVLAAPWRAAHSPSPRGAEETKC
jgi:hypothetical protein